MSSNLKVNSLVPATGTEIGIGTTGGTIDFRCPATFGGNVTIGGTLTYDEVINIDSIGIVTARSGLKVTGGQLDVGSNIKAGNAGVVTATTFVGDVTGTASNASGATGDFSIADKIIHTGDLDTKIRFPADNTISFETNSNERLRISSGGRVGINTSSPARLIHAYESTINTLLFLESGDTNVDIVQADTGGSTRIRNSQGSLVFYVNGDANSSNASNAVTGLTIDGDKDVHVYDDLFIPDKIIHEGDTNTKIRFPADDTFSVETAGSERLRIKSDGKIDVGGNESGYKFNIIDESNRTTTAETALLLYAKHDGSGTTGAGFGTGIRFWGDRASGNVEQNMGRIMCIADVNSGTNISGAFTFETGVAGVLGERLRIHSNGAVSIANTRNYYGALNVEKLAASSTAIDIKASGTDARAIAIGDHNTIQGELCVTNNSDISFGTSTNHHLTFYTNGTSNERLRIASDGDVTIDSSSNTMHPGAALNVISDKNVETGLDDMANYHLVLKNPQNDTGESIGLAFGITDTVTKVGAAIIHERDSAGSQGSMKFFCRPSNGGPPVKRLHLHANGDMTFNNCTTTINSSNYGLYFLNDSNSTKSIFIRHSREANGSHTTAEFYGNQGSMRIYGDGDVKNTNNSYGSLSDETLKQDIVDASSQWNDIKSIKVRKFRFKSNPTGDLQIGVVAQELETVSPKLVTEVATSSDDLTSTETVKSVKYSVLYMKAIKALQEAMTRIETLESEVAALKSS